MTVITSLRCLSAISGHMRIIARMRSIGFQFYHAYLTPFLQPQSCRINHNQKCPSSFEILLDHTGHLKINHEILISGMYHHHHQMVMYIYCISIAQMLYII